MKRLLKILFSVLVVLGMLSASFYLLFFDPSIANKLWVMDLRYKYVVAVDKYDWLKPTLRAALLHKDGFYRYILQGKVEKVSGGGIFLRGMDDRVYYFELDWKWPTEVYVQHHGYITSSVSMDDAREAWLTFNITDLSKSGEMLHEAYDPGALYGIMWKDTRSEREIREAYKADPTQPMYPNGEQYVNLVRYEK